MNCMHGATATTNNKSRNEEIILEQLSLFDKPKTKLSKENINNPAILRDLPYDKIYDAARKEASRKKPVFFVHKYFARRITSSFRMMMLGCLLPYDADIWDYLYDDFSDESLEDITILDPFMGGGTTIFEALRLNTKVIGNDLQPLSKFATMALIKELNKSKIKKYEKLLEKTVAKDIMHYQHTTCPCCNKTADIMYTFHVKKVKSKTDCGSHRLYSNFVLALKQDIFTLVCPKCGNIIKHNFKENGEAVCDCGFTIHDPKEGFVNHGVFTCDECGESKVISDYTPEEGYPLDTELVAIEYYCPECNSHDYKRIDDEDQALYDEACNKYDEIKDTLPTPDQIIPNGYNTNQILNHHYQYFYELFNKRQLLGLGLLLKAINEIDDNDIKFWFQLAFSGMLEMNNMFCRYQANAHKICNIFFNHAYVPITMPVENNVWGTKLGTGNFTKTIDKIIRGKDFCTNIYDISTVKRNGKIEVIKKYTNESVLAEPTSKYADLSVNNPLICCGNSCHLSFIPDKSVNLVITDPPFGANVMYSELIDFFHSWDSKSSLASELGFDQPLSPKEDEIIVNSTRGKTQKDYENGLTDVFSECHRVLFDNGFLIFSFHDNSIESWLSILQSINNAGFILEKTYPLHAESRTGAHTSNKNSIALDIMLICRKKNNNAFVTITEDLHKEIEKTAYNHTEQIIKRLLAVDAEITLPDISNIFVSEFFCECTHNNILLDSVISNSISDLQKSIDNLYLYFDEYTITERRSGWWSELYKKKWEM